MRIIDEILFTTDALIIYVSEAKKRRDYLRQFVSEDNKLKNRIKIAEERLNSRYIKKE